jgi:hypothetical protein
MMTNDISHTEASLALDVVQRRQHEVLAEIDVPQWYWPALAAGWAGLGVLADYGPGWASGVVTVLFGAAHATIGPRVLSGRHGSTRVSIRHDAVSHWIPAVIIGFLVAMVALTIGIALVLNADGARHPATVAGVVVAGLVLAAGPGLMAQIRARAQRGMSS